MIRLVFSLCVLRLLVSTVGANTECIWATGRLVCRGDQSKVKNAVVEVWDRDGPKEVKVIDALDEDDMAGVTVVEEEDGFFRVEGCASDIDWLGPLHRNRPEFYLKIRHKCRSVRGEELVVQPPSAVFAPLTMDHFIDNPIVLDP